MGSSLVLLGENPISPEYTGTSSHHPGPVGIRIGTHSLLNHVLKSLFHSDSFSVLDMMVKVDSCLRQWLMISIPKPHHFTYDPLTTKCFIWVWVLAEKRGIQSFFSLYFARSSPLGLASQEPKLMTFQVAISTRSIACRHTALLEHDGKQLMLWLHLRYSVLFLAPKSCLHHHYFIDSLGRSLLLWKLLVLCFLEGRMWPHPWQVVCLRKSFKHVM